MTRVIQGITQFCLSPNTSHTCLYSVATEYHRPLASTHCAYPRRDGHAELTCEDNVNELRLVSEITEHHRQGEATGEDECSCLDECRCPRLEQSTLEMEVRETQSYTAVVIYTGQVPVAVWFMC